MPSSPGTRYGADHDEFLSTWRSLAIEFWPASHGDFRAPRLELFGRLRRPTDLAHITSARGEADTLQGSLLRGPLHANSNPASCHGCLRKLRLDTIAKMPRIRMVNTRPSEANRSHTVPVNRRTSSDSLLTAGQTVPTSASTNSSFSLPTLEVFRRPTAVSRAPTIALSRC